jgi:sugar phosphate isomerase/epimerase
MSYDERISRRTLLSRTAGAAALAAMAWRLEPLLAGGGSRWFKIGACEWSLGKGDPSCFELARQIGLDGVQVSMGVLGNGADTRKPEVQKAYLDAAKKVGLEVSSLAIGEMNSVPLKRDPRAAQWLAESIDVCQGLGVKVVLIACFGNGDLDMSNRGEIDHLVKALKNVAPKAEKAGVLMGIEDYLSAEDNMKILDRVASPAMKVYYDVGNSTDKGRDVTKEIRLLGPRICEFHAKDAGFMLGQGRIDFKAVRRAMDDIQYSGWIQIEAAAPHGLIPDYQADRKYLKEIFPRKLVVSG